MGSSMNENVASRVATLWLMGPTSAGKTTLATALEMHLHAVEGRAVTHWDGDQVRDMLGPNHGFSSDNRLLVVKTLAHLAKVTSDAGIFTIVSALTAHDDARDLVHAVLPKLYVGYIHCSIDTCIDRDPKGLYRRAISGEIDTLIGYNSPYEPPKNPDFTIDTSRIGVSQAVKTMMRFLTARNFGVSPR